MFLTERQFISFIEYKEIMHCEYDNEVCRGFVSFCVDSLLRGGGRNNSLIA